jgi:predicted DNA-binding protein
MAKKATEARNVTALAVRLPTELHRRLKGWAGLNGLKVQAVVIEALTEYLKKRGA